MSYLAIRMTRTQAKLTEELLWATADAQRSIRKALTYENAARNVRTALLMREFRNVRKEMD